MTGPAFTDEQILGAIHEALTARDMPAVADLITRLAVQAPRKAQLILDTVTTGRHPLEQLLTDLQ